MSFFFDRPLGDLYVRYISLPIDSVQFVYNSISRDYFMMPELQYFTQFNSQVPPSSSFFRDLLDSIPTLISVFDHSLALKYSNGSGSDSTNIQKRHKQHLFSALYGTETTFNLAVALINQVLETGFPVDSELYLPDFGHMEIHTFPLTDGGNSDRLAGQHVRNIDERRKVEDALSGANQMLSAIIEASPLAIIALDRSVNLTLWNPAAEQMFGWKKGEVLGHPYPLVGELLKDEFNENIIRLNNGTSRRHVETRRLHKDGSLIDVSLSTAPMCDHSGETIGYMAIFADIRERKRVQEALRQSEANYRTIFDAANDATFVFDPENGAMLDVNRKMCEMYGYQREQVLQLNVEKLSAGVPPYTYEDVLRKIWKTRYDISHMFEWLAKDSSDRLFWVEVTMKGATINGEYRVLAVVRDISERKQVEEEGKKMQERLRQIDKMAAIGTLASGIAHEINNPNNFILSNAQFLYGIWPEINRILKLYGSEYGPIFLGRMPLLEATECIPQMLKSLEEGANRINTIVTGLKNFARQEKTKSDQAVDLNKVVEAALSMLQNQIRKHTDQFTCSLEASLPRISGSFQQLEQVVVNLTMNALHALTNREDGVVLLTHHDKTASQVVLTVRDEGIGMTQELIQVIFDPFFTTKHDSGGTGLGLSICYSIAKEHGGSIDCESSPGKGSSFVVRLPTHQEGRENFR